MTELIGKLSDLDQNRQRAIGGLNDYLKRPEERVLREHQIDVLADYYSFLSDEQTAGYINLPTGSGKTVIITELASAIGLKTVILSPTLKILDQISTSAKQTSPDLSIADNYGGVRNLNGQVINTTYQSLPKLIESGEISPEEIGLLICDEAHTALGEKTHELFKRFPNALMVGLTATPYFSQIEGYRRRGVLEGNERWLGLFRNTISEMSLEEGIERGILSNLHINILRTGIKANNVSISSSGDYDASDIEKALNVHSRNQLTIALIMGTDASFDTSSIPAKTREELERIHAEIKGKKTAIFGISIKHIEGLAETLKDEGLSVGVVHGNMQHEQRKEIFDAYEKGDINIILGVDMIRLGWDSPSTEVGIYLAPTRSGIVATQELGRILRTNPNKKEAIAIQMIDIFDRGNAPIIIPNLFDPYFVLRGTMIGDEPGVRHDIGENIKPKITFSGAEIDLIIEEAKSQNIIRERINKASLKGLDELTSDLASQVYNDNPGLSPIEFYRQFASRLPQRISTDVLEKIMQAVSSIDSNTAAMGKRVAVFLYMKSILTAIDPYILGEDDLDNDLVQSAILSMFENIENKTNSNIPVYLSVKNGVFSYIAKREQVPVSWVRNNSYTLIKERISDYIKYHKYLNVQYDTGNLTEEEFLMLLSGDSGEPEDSLREYLHTIRVNMYKDPPETDPTPKAAMSDALSEEIDDVLDSLESKERRVLNKRAEGFTLRGIGNNYGLTGGRIQQIEAKALRKLRHPSRSRKLAPFLDDSQARAAEENHNPTRKERTRLFDEMVGLRNRDRPGDPELVQKVDESKTRSWITQSWITQSKGMSVYVYGLNQETGEDEIIGLQERLRRYIKYNKEFTIVIGVDYQGSHEDFISSLYFFRSLQKDAKIRIETFRSEVKARLAKEIEKEIKFATGELSQPVFVFTSLDQARAIAFPNS